MRCSSACILLNCEQMCGRVREQGADRENGSFVCMGFKKKTNGCSVREMKLRRQYKADHIMYHTCQWSMKQESHCSVNHNAQHACKQTEGWPGYLKRNVTVFKTFPLKTHTSMLLRTTKSKLRTGRDNFTEPR